MKGRAAVQRRDGKKRNKIGRQVGRRQKTEDRERRAENREQRAEGQFFV